jgi:hypothetical protein
MLHWRPVPSIKSGTLSTLVVTDDQNSVTSDSLVSRFTFEFGQIPVCEIQSTQGRYSWICGLISHPLAVVARTTNGAERWQRSEGESAWCRGVGGWACAQQAHRMQAVRLVAVVAIATLSLVGTFVVLTTQNRIFAPFFRRGRASKSSVGTSSGWIRYDRICVPTLLSFGWWAWQMYIPPLEPLLGPAAQSAYAGSALCPRSASKFEIWSLPSVPHQCTHHGPCSGASFASFASFATLQRGRCWRGIVELHGGVCCDPCPSHVFFVLPTPDVERSFTGNVSLTPRG